MRPQVGQVINNKYRLLRVIGDGGMGSVYEARHEVLGTSVALKFLHSELTKRAGLVQRFLQEARVSAQIASPHVVRVTDVDQTPGGAFIVMEYIEGKTLQTVYEELYKAGIQLSYADALEYAMQMLEGVEAAHKSGIVHRDLKPDNVMITINAKGRTLCKLLDFGIAKLKVAEDYDRKLTRPGVIMGTPEYMAPEQAYSADAVDHRADIFSLGVMIFEMLAGRRPVGGEDAHQIAAAYLSGQIARITDLAPEIAPGLAEAVHKAMAALPGDRWQTVTALRDAIEPFAVAVRAPSALPPSPSMVMAAVPASWAIAADPPVAMGGDPPYPPARPVPVAKSSPGAARVVPETFAGPKSGEGPIPKTLPPEGDDDATRAMAAVAPPAPERPAAPPLDDASPATATPTPMARRNATLAAEPPSMTNPPSRDPTPLGGFSAVGPDGVPVATDGRPSASSVLPFAPGAHDGSDLERAGTMGAAAPNPRSGLMSPQPARVDPSSTVLASPLAGTVPAFEVAAGISGVADAGGPRLRHSGVHPPVVPVPAYAMAPAQPANTRKRKSALSSLPVILLLATGISGAVVGGVYFAQYNAKIDDHDDRPAPPPAATTVQSDPPDEPPSSAAPGPAIPPPAHPWRPSGPPLKPPPKGSAGPVAPPPSSTAPAHVPIIPSVWPPVIPSSFPPFFPFGPRQADPPPPKAQQPDGPRPTRSEAPPGNLSVPLAARRPAQPVSPPPPPEPSYWE